MKRRHLSRGRPRKYEPILQLAAAAAVASTSTGDQNSCSSAFSANFMQNTENNQINTNISNSGLWLPGTPPPASLQLKNLPNLLRLPAPPLQGANFMRPLQFPNFPTSGLDLNQLILFEIMDC